MAKKSFSKAPALQFLTRPIEEEEEIVSTASEKEAPSLADFTDKTEDAAKVIIEEADDKSKGGKRQNRFRYTAARTAGKGI